MQDRCLSPPLSLSGAIPPVTSCPCGAHPQQIVCLQRPRSKTLRHVVAEVQLLAGAVRRHLLLLPKLLRTGAGNHLSYTVYDFRPFCPLAFDLWLCLARIAGQSESHNGNEVRSSGVWLIWCSLQPQLHLDEQHKKKKEIQSIPLFHLL